MAIPIHVVHLRDRLLAQLSRPMQLWVTEQAQQIVRSGRFGPWERMRLGAALRQKLSQDCAAAGPILSFLTLQTAVAIIEAADRAGDNAQLANVDMQELLQQEQQSIEALSSIAEAEQNEALAIMRKIGS